MKSIKEIIQSMILNLNVRHKLLSDEQMYYDGLKDKTLKYNLMELNKAWIELKVAILKSFIGE